MAFNHEKGLCCVSSKDRLIFIGVSSNASTSIRNALNILNYNNNYLSLMDNNTCGIKYTTFTIIREPIQRLISGYIKVCVRATQDSPHILKKKFYWERDQKKRFYLFVDELERHIFDCHIEKQIFYLTDHNSNMLNIDYFLKMEHLKDDFSGMCRQLGLDYRLEHLNKGIESSKITATEKSITYYMKNAITIRSLKSPYALILLKIIKKIKLLLNSRPIPNKNEILQLIKDDPTLLQRIKNLYKEDFILYENSKSSF